MSFSVSSSWPARASTSPRSAVTCPESAKFSSKSREAPSPWPSRWSWSRRRSRSSWSWPRSTASVVSDIIRCYCRAPGLGRGFWKAVLPAGTRVGEVVDRPQPLRGDACVDLGGGEAGVAEELLDHADVGAVVEHVGAARVPEHVGEEPVAEPGPVAGRAHDEPGTLTGEPATPCVQKHGVAAALPRRRAPLQLGSTVLEVVVEGGARGAPERDHPFLAPLAEHPGDAVAQVEVAPLEAH